MTDLRDYLREEIEEEGRLGYLSAEESARRARLLDAQSSAAPGTEGAGASAATETYDDGRVEASWIEIAGAAGPLTVYTARPTEGGDRPGVVLVHENKGLTAYIQDVARRLAAAGFVALAPDLLTPAGGTRSFADPAEVTAALGQIDPADMIAELKAAVTYLTTPASGSNGAVGAVGFCFGGGMTWRLVTQDPRLAGAVAFYGPNPPLEDIAAIETPVFAVYGELDARITSGVPDIEAAMKEHGKSFEYTVFEGAQHAFHNDTNPDRYHSVAAAAAWDAAIAHLRGWLAT